MSAEGFEAAGYRQIFEVLPENPFERLCAVIQTPPCDDMESVDLQAAGEGVGRYQTTVEGLCNYDVKAQSVSQAKTR